jgi:hypothetical protein
VSQCDARVRLHVSADICLLDGVILVVAVGSPESVCLRICWHRGRRRDEVSRLMMMIVGHSMSAWVLRLGDLGNSVLVVDRQEVV